MIVVVCVSYVLQICLWWYWEEGVSEDVCFLDRVCYLLLRLRVLDGRCDHRGRVLSRLRPFDESPQCFWRLRGLLYLFSVSVS